MPAKPLRLAALCLALALPASAQTLRIGTEGAFAPYNFIDNGGTLQGFDIDVGNAICAEAGLTCEWVLEPWASIIPGLLKHRYDAIMAGMAATPERAELIAFSAGYEDGGASALFVCPANAPLPNPETALIAVQTETIHLDYVKERGLRYVAYPHADDLAKAVATGAADLALGSTTHLRGLIQNAPGRLREVSSVEIDTGETIVGLRKEDVELKTKIDAAIITLRDDGTIAALRDKWFSAGAGTF
ncbi:transporter substrate-binding domain-containing protein [Alphaproteobacteria bacterium KMM 3653]|uniref:Transporter substrate-binding domain-containing protein n=1 Tax=Harenicola maris TaxID=2841044 RepID=A0AAP2CNT8_9RHOB|nr:transporter substrate-binding domain-containing protein [Harenicola maris]